MTNFSILDTPANEVWAEIKVKDKSIQKRCYHISFIYNSRLISLNKYNPLKNSKLDYMFMVDTRPTVEDSLILRILK